MATLRVGGVALLHDPGHAVHNLSDSLAGIFDLAPGFRISSNNVTSTGYGVFLLTGGTVQSNDMSNASYGVFLEADGAIIQSNRITLAATAGVEFNCHAAIVSRNTINDAPVGLGDVPARFSGSNTFANTGTINTDGCVPTAAAGSSPRAASQSAAASHPAKPSSCSHWRTPANPLDSRP